jgi:hypothetical protein
VNYASAEQFTKPAEWFPKVLLVNDFKPKAKLAWFSIEMRNMVGALREQTDSVKAWGEHPLRPS